MIYTTHYTAPGGDILLAGKDNRLLSHEKVDMESKEILKYCLENLEDTVLVESWGEKGIFYNPNNVLKRGVYVLTIKEKDGDNDKSSNIDRENV